MTSEQLETLARRVVDELRAGRRSSPIMLPVSLVPTFKRLVEAVLRGETIATDPH